MLFCALAPLIEYHFSFTRLFIDFFGLLFEWVHAFSVGSSFSRRTNRKRSPIQMNMSSLTKHLPPRAKRKFVFGKRTRRDQWGNRQNRWLAKPSRPNKIYHTRTWMPATVKFTFHNQFTLFSLKGSDLAPSRSRNKCCSDSLVRSFRFVLWRVSFAGPAAFVSSSQSRRGTHTPQFDSAHPNWLCKWFRRKI